MLVFVVPEFVGEEGKPETFHHVLRTDVVLAGVAENLGHAALVEAVRLALDGPDADAYERLRTHLMTVANATASDVCRRGCLLAKGTAELSEHDPAVA